MKFEVTIMLPAHPTAVKRRLLKLHVDIGICGRFSINGVITSPLPRKMMFHQLWTYVSKIKHSSVV